MFFAQDKDFFEKYLSGLVGEVFGEELMDKTKPDYYMVNFLRDDILDEDGVLVEEAPKVNIDVPQDVASLTGSVGCWNMNSSKFSVGHWKKIHASDSSRAT